MTTLLTAAGTIDRAAVMCRAWDLMKINYNFGRLPFRSIGRKCFGSCLRCAWAEARQQAAVAAIPPAVRAERIADLNSEMSNLRYLDDWRHVAVREREIRDELHRLAA
ncbi:hypothetical protein EYW49_22330 [Siculibacillus lacustris]|uniref:Uncharacterized protein n=1 Tax=Siculibacillus lacustris TaxID=1549641 RepID=A0A4Q9VCL7_9HYPH|nr:hypothetical protein [Siculibacillus lacustris]TBW32253.1 hypothetical protein EYW49_22330 [Siculibacillus lacustris]